MVSDLRLYAGASLALSGIYANFSSTFLGIDPVSVVGFVAILHGLVFLLGIHERIMGWNGPLTVIYAVFLVGNQLTVPVSSMDPGMYLAGGIMMVSGLILLYRDV